MEGPEERLWMYKRKGRGGLGISPRFEQGVLEFDEFVKQQHRNIYRDEMYLCPCKKCKNVKLQSSDVVKQHLYKWGFVVGYWYWIYHGEIDPRNYHYGEGSEQVMQDSEPEIEENYMQTMMNDVIETNEAHTGDEIPNSRATSFLNMVNSAQQPLYEGGYEACSKSELDLSIRLLSIKADFNPSQKHFKAWVALFKDFMPPTHDRIPKSLPILMRKVAQLGLDVKIIDCCRNSCMLYYKEYAELNACKFCGEARRKSSKGRKKLGQSFSKLYYLPLTDRLQRLYASRNIAPHMRWHKEHEQEKGVLRHPSDARAWKHFDYINPEFAAEPRNVRLGLCADGFTPYKDDARSYSIWPVVVTPYNLPPNMCMKTEFMFLTLLIPGPKSPGNRIDVYLQPLIDELMLLWNEGVETYDISCGRNFNMRANLMWTINDFPALGMLSGWSTHGKLSCPVCMDRNIATTLTHGKKRTWFDHHRCFLPMIHKLRSDKKLFTKGKVVKEEAPKRYSPDQIWEMVEDLSSVVDSVDFNIPGFRSNQNNWTKRSIFWDLPYWGDNLLPHNIDIMHTEKNFSENIINTVMDTTRSKDDVNARRDMAEICDRPELNLTFNGQRAFKPKAKCSLTLEQRRNVCEWMRGVRLPDGYGSNPKNLVHPNNKEFAHMKSHDHHVFLQTLLPVTFSALPKEVLEPLVELSQFFKNLCASELHEDKLKEMDRRIPVILCKLEAHFPPAFFNVMEHLPVHLAEEALLRGPCMYGWMYGGERFFGVLKPFAKNKAHPEVSIVRVYLAYEIAKFTSVYFNGEVECSATRIGRNQVPKSTMLETETTLSVFQWKGIPKGRTRRKRYLTEGNEWFTAHLHVLLNCPEVEPYLECFKLQVRRNVPNVTDVDVDKYIRSHFNDWFKQQVVVNRRYTDPVQQYLIELSHGPDTDATDATSYTGYVVDGVKYQTETKTEGMQTCGAGVMVKGVTGDSDSCDCYGVIKDIVCIKYHGIPPKQCMLFKCHWFDTSKKGVSYSRLSPYASVNHKSKYGPDDPFIFADTAHQVMYLNYPPGIVGKKDWWVAIPCKSRGNPNGDKVFESGIYQEDTMGDTRVSMFQITPVLVDDSVNADDITEQLHSVLAIRQDGQIEDEDQEYSEGEWDEEEEDTDDELFPTYDESTDDESTDDEYENDDDLQ